MVAEAPATATGNKKLAPPPPLPLPPGLFLVRARSRASRVADLDYGAAAAWSSAGPPDTPPRRSPLTVPFLWEEAPGKPKGGAGAPAATVGAIVPSDAGSAAAVVTTTPAAGAGDHGTGDGENEAPRPAPLKLPPRLQRVASARQERDGSLSSNPALHGPNYCYYGCAGGGGKRPPAPRRTASGFSAFRRAPSIGAGLFSRITKSKGGGGGHLSAAAAPPDAPWCSPAASSASSMSSTSSSLSARCFGDDGGHGGHHRLLADGREDGSSEEEECAGRGTVRITRFRRNRSFPNMTRSHLWASIRKSVKQIAPWS